MEKGVTKPAPKEVASPGDEKKEKEKEVDELSEDGSSEEELTLNGENGKELDNSVEAEDIEDVNHSENCSTCPSVDISNDQDHHRIDEILSTMNEPNNRYDWTTLAIRAGITTVLYPTQMAQILMQVGYEPFQPRPSVTLLGRPCLILPSSGGYLRYIYQVDGLRGIFRGLSPRIAQQLLFTYAFESVRCHFKKMHNTSMMAKLNSKGDADLSIEGANDVVQCDDSEQSDASSAGFVEHFREVLHDLASKVAAIVVSYPVHVVVIRTIAHFIGREHCIRRGVFGEIQAIYTDFGLMGFYRGLVPKLIGETCQTLAVGALAYFVSNQAPGAEIRSLLNVSFSILVSAWTYQFSVVSATMAVNGSCLKIGQPPLQPTYDNWVQCWRDLGRLNLLNRGSSIICRYYTGPMHQSIHGIREPVGVHFGPNHLGLNYSVEAQEKIAKSCRFATASRVLIYDLGAISTSNFCLGYVWPFLGYFLFFA